MNQPIATIYMSKSLKGSKLVCHAEKTTAQIANLVFADTQANAEKPKELFFANAQ